MNERVIFTTSYFSSIYVRLGVGLVWFGNGQAKVSEKNFPHL